MTRQHFEIENHTTTGTPSDTLQIVMLGYPSDVLTHPGLPDSEKRSILAAWASDARAAENAPTLRQLDNGAVVTIDEILQALRALDNAKPTAEADATGRRQRPPSNSPGLCGRWRVGRKALDWIRRDNDDDDPPPCPASAALPTRQGIVAAVGPQVAVPA